MSERKVWVVTITPDNEYGLPAGYQVMIEQFDDNPPSIAFRPHASAVWSAPMRAVVS